SYVGLPADTTSRWSFARWQRATNGDASRLRELFDRDRNVFYDEIAHDPSLLEGWSGDPAGTRAAFTEMRRVGDDRLRYARYVGTGLWINHIVSAVDALRSARLHNFPLGRDLQLGLSSRWRHGAPVVVAELKRSF